MPSKTRYCPGWTWWIRAGERLQMGLGLDQVLAGGTGSADERLQRGMVQVRRQLGEGRTVVQAFRNSGLQLPGELWSLLQSGEQTGRLGEALREVGDRLRRRLRRRRELAGQLWYPALVVTCSLMVMLVILVWVIPRLKEVSQSMGLGQELPWITESIGLIYGTAFLFAILSGATLLVFLFVLRRMGLRFRPAARLQERFLTRLPLAGNLLFWQREARLLRQVGTCLESGITLPRALEMGEADATSLWEISELKDFRRRLVMGIGLDTCFRDCRLLSPDTIDVLLVGQECGRLDHYMQRLAAELEEGISWRINQSVRLLEPLLLLGLSLGVGLLLLAYLLPMVRMLEQLA